MSLLNLTIDGKEISAKEGTNLVAAAKDNGIFIPTLCYLEGKECLGTCRVCSVKIDGRIQSGCTFNVQEGMNVEVRSEELDDLRKSLIELLFVEGNHFCPSCEKSGDCDLQALAYEMRMDVARYPYRFSPYEVDFSGKNILIDQNRCVHCKRCTDLFCDDQGKKVFAFTGRGEGTAVHFDLELEAGLSLDKQKEVTSLCPVGAILKKGQGFKTAYGERKYDTTPISKGGKS